MYYVKVTASGIPIVRKFTNDEFELASEVFDLAQEEFGEPYTHFYSSRPYPPPKGWRRNGNRLWCPYCGQERLYIYSSRWNLCKCPVCGMTEKDFYVRRFNGMDRILVNKGGEIYVDEVRLQRKRG